MATAIGSYATWALLKPRLGITDSTDDVQGGLICDQINAFIEGPEACGRAVCPIPSATYLFDGDGSPVIWYPKGIRAVSLVEVAYYTTGAYVTLPANQYFVRPTVNDRPPGFPGDHIQLTNLPLTFAYFPVGFEIVRVTMTTGFDATPDDVTQTALVAAAKAWHALQAGQQDIVGTDEMGRPLVSQFFSQADRAVLSAYSVNLPG